MNARERVAQLDAEFNHPRSTMGPEEYGERRAALRSAPEDASAPADDPAERVVTRGFLTGFIEKVVLPTLMESAFKPIWARLRALEEPAAAAADDLAAIGTRLSNVETRCGALSMMNGRGDKVAEVEDLLRRVKALEGIEARIKALENRPAGMKYVGVHRDGLGYESGSVVTHGGSMWHANVITTTKPGTSGDWTLCVKQGKHARDAR